jgi:hypothetical protein
MPRRPVLDVIEVLPDADAELLPETKVVTEPAPEVVDLTLIPKAPRVRLAQARRPSQFESAWLYSQVYTESNTFLDGFRHSKFANETTADHSAFSGGFSVWVDVTGLKFSG